MNHRLPQRLRLVSTLGQIWLLAAAILLFSPRVQADVAPGPGPSRDGCGCFVRSPSSPVAGAIAVFAALFALAARRRSRS